MNFIHSDHLISFSESHGCIVPCFWANLWGKFRANLCDSFEVDQLNERPNCCVLMRVSQFAFSTGEFNYFWVPNYPWRGNFEGENAEIEGNQMFKQFHSH